MTGDLAAGIAASTASWPAWDASLAHAVQARYGLDHLPDPAEVADLAQRWRPYRSLASSLLLAAARPT